MKAKIAGVALAAVMAWGWASGAEAAALPNGHYFNVEGSFTDETNSSFSYGIGAGNKPGQAYIIGPIQYEIFPDASAFEIDITQGTYQGFSGSFVTLGGYGYRNIPYDPNGGDFTLFAVSGSFGGTFFSRSITSSSAIGTFNDLQFLGLSSAQFDNFEIGAGDTFRGPLTISSLTLAVVPLPATATLFGVALLALGSIGYAQRSRAMRI